MTGCWTVGLAALLGGCANPSATTPPRLAAAYSQPEDCRWEIPSSAFEQKAAAEWTYSGFDPWLPFDELVYSWRINRPGDTFRLYLKAVFSLGDETDWLYAGYWGDVQDLVANRKPPAFDRGTLDMDWLKLKAKAMGFRFKVVGVGPKPLAAPPSLTVITTDNHPKTRSTTTVFRPAQPPCAAARVLDVPLRRQVDSRGERLKDKCQSAALSSAMEYFGKSVPLEAVVRHTFDPEYGYPGLWPRVIGAAQEFGFDGYIERFRDWDAVRRALAENKILLCSMRMKAGECEAPPYPSMGNHIVALCGVTDDGRVVVTDSFLGKSGRGYLCQWLQRDFEKVWLQTKGGIAMVICPPPGAVERRVKDLPPFPKDRAWPDGDDH